MKNKNETIFQSDWIDKKDILIFLEDIEKTGRVKMIELIDETGLTWTKKELKKYLTKLEEEPDDIKLYFDASFHKETGEAGVGIVIYYKLGEKNVRHRLNEKIDVIHSNNEAEYIALYYGIERLAELKISGKKIDILGDSQGLLMQLRGEWPCYEERLNQWLDRIEEKIKSLRLYPVYTPIPRHKNKEADKLARQAMENMIINSKNIEN